MEYPWKNVVASERQKRMKVTVGKQIAVLRSALLVTLLLASVACPKSDHPTLSIVEQQIIEAVVNDNDESTALGPRGLSQTASSRCYLVGDMSEAFRNSEMRKNSQLRDTALNSAIEDFIRKNSVDTELVFPKKLSEKIVLIPEQKVRDIHDSAHSGGDAWGSIKSRFGVEEIYQVSRPGIDDKRSVALVCVNYASARAASTGRFYILRFDGAKWVVQKEESFAPRWMSEKRQQNYELMATAEWISMAHMTIGQTSVLASTGQ